MSETASNAASNAASIEVRDLTRWYDERQVLHGISFRVEPGQIVGFLGPNGAGKSTTMKILTGSMAASSGTARVAGFDVHDESRAARARVGYLPESVPLYEDMLVFDYLMFMAELRGVSSMKRRGRVRDAAKLTGLTAMMGRSIRELSRGYRQRVGLAQAIVHEPEVVILDEPISGLDPNQLIEIRDLIKHIGAEKTVLFSSHIMQEVAAVCDRVIILHEGRIVADDTVDALKAAWRAEHPGLLVRLALADDSPRAVKKLVAKLTRAPHVSAVEDTTQADGTLSARVRTDDPDALRQHLFAMAAEDDLPLTALGPYAPDLEDIFRWHTRPSRA